LLGQKSLNLAYRHAPGVHGDDFVVETGEATLVLGDEQGLEATLTVARNVNGGLKLTQFSHLQRLKTDTPQILCRIGVLEGGPKAQPERCLCGAALTQ
jgi:hypothetical protein